MSTSTKIREMHSSKEDLQAEKIGDYEVRAVQWGGMNVEFEKAGSDLDITPYLKGLPDNLDQSLHWGYVIKGEFITKYKDHEEHVKAGQIYYSAPGHTTIVKKGTELVEFSPIEKFNKTMETITRNMESTQK